MKTTLKLLAATAAIHTSIAMAGTPPIGSIDVPELVTRVDKGVVNIQAVTLIRERLADPMAEDFFFQFYGVPRERIRKQPSLGSGFVIDDNGFILTNNHVVERASEIEVFFDDGKKTKLKAKVIGTDKKSDIALLQVKPGPYLLPLSLGNSDAVKVGESVVAIGNPFGLSHTVTAGIVSAKNRVIGQGPFDNFLQTDASINPGNSGGPLFNSHGEVIGINAAINANGQGLGFAIPVNQAKKLIPDLKKYGRVLRGWLGALVVTTPQGVFVDGVVLRSSAHKAGLQSGDRISEINGSKVEERVDIDRAIEDKRPGDIITVVVDRLGRLIKKVQKYEVKLGEEPEGDIPA
ncbi:MAG: S1C family serine protease, partial [Bdellovibrionota bacterium]